MSLISRAVARYRRHGAGNLLEATLRYGIRESLGRYLLVHSDEQIRSVASDCHHIEGGSESEIEYTGRWEPPHPAPLEFVDGLAIATPRLLCEFQDVRLIGSRPAIALGRRFVAPSSIGTAGYEDSPVRARETLYENVRLADLTYSLERLHSSAPDFDSAFLLTGHFQRFGHWTYEILPKLRAFESYVEQTGAEPALLVAGPLTSWQRESLALLGYPPDAYHALDTGPTHVEQLLVPSHRYLATRYVPSYPAPGDLKWVSGRIHETLDSAGTSFGDRIYVSRADAPQRQVHNRDAVHDVLEAYDFERYEPGRLSFADQVRLFSGADVVAGPFGAGLSNVVFTEDATVVEFHLDAKHNMHHYVLANLLDLDYEYVECRPVHENGVGLHNSDLVVDTEQLRTVLEAVT